MFLLKNNIKFSIITVTFNSEKTILDTLKSIKKQNYLNYEHLIIDGGSTDKTISIIKRFKNKKSKIKMFIEKDKGIYYAMNKGISKSKGNYINFLNSDDIFFSSNVLTKIALILKKEKTEILYGDIFCFKKKNFKKERVWISSKYKSESFLNGWSPPHPSTFIKKKIFIKFGNFKTKYKFAADTELLYRFIEQKAVRTTYIPSFLVKMRLGGQSNKNYLNIIKQNLEIISFLKKNKKFFLINFLFKKLMFKISQYKII